jgi:hypothetical protein
MNTKSTLAAAAVLALSSHAIYVSQPQAVIKLIEEAAKSADERGSFDGT